MTRKHWISATIAAGLAMIVTGGAAPAMAGPEMPYRTDLVIHKYIGAPIPDAPRNGTELDTSNWEGVTPANGVVFEIHEIGGRLISATEPRWPDIPEVGTYILDPEARRLEVYKDSTLVGRYWTLPPTTVTTGPDGTGMINLRFGFYLVVENLAASTNVTDATTGQPVQIIQTQPPFLVDFPMRDPSGTGWLDTVHVYPKNNGLTVTKTVDPAGTVAVGDKVSYTVTTSVPANITNSTKFIIVDTLDPALSIVENSLALSTQPALTGDNALAENLDYIMAYNADGRFAAVTFTDAGRVKLGKATNVTLTFDATINSAILNAPDLCVANIGNVELTTQADVDFDLKSNEVTVCTANIEITKVDQFSAALNGATFKIATTEANAKANQFLRIDPVTKVLFDYDASPSSTWAMLGADHDYRIDPANVDRFAGLRDIVDINGIPTWQTFWIVETAAPEDYNRLTAPIEVAFVDAFNKFEDPADYNHTYQLTVYNSKGFILPETGGTGTIIWTVAGVVLIGFAVLVGVTKRKKTTVR